jgi:hypothetical protein
MRMEMNTSSWNTHDWIGRRLKLAPGEALIQMGCRECGREFVDECATGERYAVHVSIFRLHRLSAEVTSRWLSEKCPAERTMTDDADRQTRFIGGSFRSAGGEIANYALAQSTSSNGKIA